MFSLFANSESNTFALIIDVGSASIGGALVVFSDNEKPRIIYATRVDMAFQEEFDITHFKTSMKQSMQKVVERIETDAWEFAEGEGYTSIKIEHVYCFLSSPWYATKTQTLKKVQQEPFVVDEACIQSEIEKAVSDFENEEGVRKVVGSGGAELIERSIINFSLNGYDIEHPRGKKASDLEMTLLISIMPTDGKRVIENELQRAFTRADITFHSFPFAAFHVIRSIEKEADTFLFIDISGEETDVSLVREGILQEVQTFSVGKKTLIRALAKKLHTSPSEAGSLIRMYQEDRFADTRKKEIRDAFVDIQKVWKKSFHEALSAFQDTIIMPHDVYITADSDIASLIAQLVEKENAAQYSAMEDSFQTHMVNAAFFSGMCRLQRDLKPDPFLMTGAVFADTLDSA